MNPDPIVVSHDEFDGVDASLTDALTGNRIHRAAGGAVSVLLQGSVNKLEADCRSKIRAARYTGQPYQEPGFVDACACIRLQQ